MVNLKEASVQESGLILRTWLGLLRLLVGLTSKVGRFLKKAWAVRVEDPKKVIHCFKVAMALTFLSLFFSLRPLYKGVGENGIWAVMTVVVVFEYTVGATISKSLNRIAGTILAESLAIGVNWIARESGEGVEPIILGATVFLLASAVTFSRFIPAIKAGGFDYGALIFILTFSMISVSGCRVDNFLQMAYQTMYTIAIGACLCMLISMLVYPIWAGEELHLLITCNIEKLANSLDVDSLLRYHGRCYSVCTFLILLWSKKEVLRLLFLLFLGQVVSFILAIAGFCSSLLANLGVDLPLTQSFFNYALLALVFGCILLFRRQRLQVPWYWYILLGFIDVQGNYLVVKAFQYTSITSVTILDCWTIPWVMILTWIFIRTRYSLWQFLGVAVCVVGLCLVLLSDAGIVGGGEDKPLLGDFLVIIGTMCNALSNVGEEYCVKKKDLVEVIAMLGVFGLLVSIGEISLMERKTLEEVKWTAEIISLFAGFALSTFLFYCLVPFVLKMSGATMFNLSLLTSDMWAVVIRIFFYHQQVNWLYFLAFGVVAIGLFIYSLTEEDHVPTTAIADGGLNIQYEVLTQETAASGNEVLAT